MTLKNKLQVTPVSKASDIATEAENHIRTLDVYVFGSDTEDGDYTFQEQFAYRENSGDVPYGATSLDLEANGTEGAETTTLLSLKKGLFVKLYCVANQPDLVNPAKTGNNGIVSPSDFSSLELTTPGQSGTTIAKTGVPTLTDFLTFHTPLLNATSAADTLVTPLPMSGAYTTPLDLTDFKVSARTQIGFKLSRMVSRFDITNDASKSKFTIESISMAKGRRGASLFPIKVYAGTPLDATDLITYPSRLFWGDKANIGTQTGAFYTWPSLIEDGGYLILKGKYHVNQTETKEVTYQVPFKQNTSDGSGTYLEITHNHRYTIGITKADEYHLDFNLTVSDWTDGGSLDDYTPEEDGETSFNVTIPPADNKTLYDADTKTVNLSLNAGSYFDLEIESQASFTMAKYYVGGPAYQKYDWLEVTTPESKTKTKAEAEATEVYGCKVSLRTDYAGERFPRAILRFQSVTDGSETIFIVQPLSAPQVTSADAIGEGNFNSFDKTNMVLSMYRTSACLMQMKLLCIENIELTSPDWMDIKLISESGIEHLYEVKLTNPETSDNEGSILLKNAVFGDLTSTLRVKLLDTDIQANNLNVTAASSGTTKLPVTSPQGCTATVLNTSWSGGGQWFSFGKNNTIGGTDNIEITQPDNKSTLMKGVTVRLLNKINGGKSKDVTITPTGFSAPSFSSSSGTLQNVRNEYTTSLTFTVSPPSGSYEYTGISNSDIATVTQSGDRFTVTAKYKGTTTLNFRNKSETGKTSSFTITVARDWRGKAVWKYSGYYIAPDDLASTSWNPYINCNAVGGANWYIPSSSEFLRIIGASSYYPTNSTGSTFQTLKNNGVFVPGYYWTMTEFDGTSAYAMGFYSDRANVGPWVKSDGSSVRCISSN